jgi:hypothetical protein
MIAGGGNCCTSTTATFEVWILKYANGLGGTPQWVKLAPLGTPPPPRLGLVGIYEGISNELVFFGGSGGGTFNEVWKIKHANGVGGTPEYIQLSPSGVPPAPRGGVVANPTAIYDDASRRMTIFGGAAAGLGLVNDTWVLELNSSDSTPPLITPFFSGTLGNNGWYRSTVSVTWSVTDGESPVTSTTGCDPTTLTADTAGATSTCTATSAGGTASESVTVKIDQTPPTIAGTKSPPPNGDGWNNSDVTVTFTCGDALSGPVTGGAQYLVTSEGAMQGVSHTCHDSAGNNSAATVVVSLDKSAPSVANLVLAPNPQALGGIVTVSADLSDSLSGLRSWRYTIDGGAPVLRTAAGSSASVSDPIALNSPGVYKVCVSAIDLADNSSTEHCAYAVIYDPNGGFVTGGGWFMSPPGAYPAAPALTGKANFGFVSKYLNGANKPTGNTQFQFHAAGLTFKSTDYDWLVVAGARAQYKGTGAVNGADGYKFILTAIDGQQPGGGGTDRIRIKIWKDEVIVYDNQIGVDDDAQPATVLGGGSIVIHK